MMLHIQDHQLRLFCRKADTGSGAALGSSDMAISCAPQLFIQQCQQFGVVIHNEKLCIINVLADFGFVAAYCIYIIFFCSEHSSPILVLHIGVTLEYHECTLSFEISHEICHCKFWRYRHKHVDMIWHRMGFYNFNMLVITKHPQYFANIFSQFSVYHFSAIFRYKYNMITSY